MKNGRWEYFSPKGTLTSRGSYVNDRKRGVWSYFDEAGRKEERSHD
jgi:antitoxin component YwqK of YwqJK toxin-antitoxin module